MAGGRVRGGGLLAALALATAGCSVGAAQSPPTAHPSSAAASSGGGHHASPTASSGPTAVGRRELRLTEALPGAQPRHIAVYLFYPVPARPASGAAGGAAPLVVFSPGYDIDPLVYAPLLDVWVRAGYVVAEPSYPHTAPTSPGGLNEGDIVYHPRDLAYVIGRLLAPGSGLLPTGVRLAGAGRVAVAGHSDGGDVTLALAAAPCCRLFVPRAALILSGAELASFGADYFSGGPVPMLVVQGTKDAVNPPACSTSLYDEDRGPRYYLSVAGKGHLSPYTGPGPSAALVARITTAFLDRYLRDQPAALAAAPAQAARWGSFVAGAPVPQAPGGCPGAPGR